jgi:hypothetical protein
LVSRKHHASARAFIVACVILILSVSAGLAAAPKKKTANAALQEYFNGIILAAVPPRPGQKYDTTVLSIKVGLQRMKAALTALKAGSPNNWRDIERLQSAGPVVLLYAPGYLEDRLTHNVAVFLPDFGTRYQSSGKSKILNVAGHRINLGKNVHRIFFGLVGRHGIKWPVKELAVVLAHEFSGHGMQQYNAEIGELRDLDLECQAYLKEEMGYRGLKFPLHFKERVNVRKAMDRYFCTGFKKYLQQSGDKAWAVWNSCDFHVPTLLAAFDRYTDHLVDTGVIARTQRAVQKHQQAELKRLRDSGELTPKQAFSFAEKLWNGNLGIKRNRKEAALWVTKAADAGYMPAMTAAATLHIKGKYLPKDNAKALALLRAAGLKGHVPAQFQLGRIYTLGEVAPRDHVEAYAWLKLAAKGKNEDARDLLFELAAELPPDEIVAAEAKAQEYAAAH